MWGRILRGSYKVTETIKVQLYVPFYYINEKKEETKREDKSKVRGRESRVGDEHFLKVVHRGEEFSSITKSDYIVIKLISTRIRKHLEIV